MPQFKISKTKLVNKLPTNLEEDTLYIVKNKNNFGELYYDYDINNRIKLSDSNQLYKYNGNINGNLIITINDSSNLKLIEFTINGNDVRETPISINAGTVNTNNMYIGQFIIFNNGIGIITNVENTKIGVVPFYIDKHLEWVDLPIQSN